MHASNIALLVLAASTAAPALAAPLLHPNGRSLNDVVPLNRRQPSGDCSNGMPKTMFVDDTAVNPGFNELGPGLGPELAKSRGLEETQLAARDFVDDNVATVTRSDSEQAMQSRGSLTDFEQLLEGIFRRDDAAGELAELLQSRNWFSDFEDIAASFLRRDGERSEFADDLQSRNWFSDFEDIAASLLRRDGEHSEFADGLQSRNWFSDFEDIAASFLRRDGERSEFADDLQSRNWFSDFEDIAASFLRRDGEHSESADDLQSRNWFSDFEEIAASFLRRDGERSEFADDLQSRNWFSDFEEIATSFLRRDVTPDGLNRRYMAGDALDEFIDYFMMNARDLGPELDIEARSIGDSALETMARRDAVDDFIALLKSRDSSTPESLLSLASRALNDLD